MAEFEMSREALIAEARGWVGTPYRHQQSLKDVGCDCLGLIRGLWRAFYGPEPAPLPAYTSDWAETSGEETLLNAARRYLYVVPAPCAPLPGDVLLFRWRPHLPAKHCAVLSEPGRIVHAYDAAGRVCEVNLAREWAERHVATFSFPGIV